MAHDRVSKRPLRVPKGVIARRTDCAWRAVGAAWNRQGAAGDLYLAIRRKPHSTSRRPARSYLEVRSAIKRPCLRRHRSLPRPETIALNVGT